LLAAQPFQQLRLAPATDAGAEVKWCRKIAGATYTPKLRTRDPKIIDNLALIEQRIIRSVGIFILHLIAPFIK